MVGYITAQHPELFPPILREKFLFTTLISQYNQKMDTNTKNIDRYKIGKKAYMKKYRIENKDKIILTRKKYVQKNKKIISKVRKKHRIKNSTSIAKYQKQYRLKTSEKRKQYQREWYKNNPEKGRFYRALHRSRKLKNGGMFSQEDISKLLISQQNKCVYCTKELKEYHIDHIIPISKGGSNWPDNLQILCRFCNQSKHDKLPEEFAKTINLCKH